MALINFSSPVNSQSTKKYSTVSHNRQNVKTQSNSYDNSLLNKIKEKELNLKEMELRLKENDLYIKELKCSINSNKLTEKQLKDSISEKNLLIKKLEATIAEKDNKIEQLNNDIAEKNNENIKYNVWQGKLKGYVK